MTFGHILPERRGWYIYLSIYIYIYIYIYIPGEQIVSICFCMQERRNYFLRHSVDFKKIMEENKFFQKRLGLSLLHTDSSDDHIAKKPWWRKIREIWIWEIIPMNYGGSFSDKVNYINKCWTNTNRFHCSSKCFHRSLADWIKGKFKKKEKLIFVGGARGAMVIVVGNGHGDTSSNPGRYWLHFTTH